MPTSTFLKGYSKTVHGGSHAQSISQKLLSTFFPPAESLPSKASSVLWGSPVPPLWKVLSSSLGQEISHGVFQFSLQISSLVMHHHCSSELATQQTFQRERESERKRERDLPEHGACSLRLLVELYVMKFSLIQQDSREGAQHSLLIHLRSGVLSTSSLVIYLPGDQHSQLSAGFYYSNSVTCLSLFFFFGFWLIYSIKMECLSKASGLTAPLPPLCNVFFHRCHYSEQLLQG